MFSCLKKHFIPHAGNEHRPHLLRDESIRNIVAVVIFIEIFSFLIPTLSHLNLTGGMAAVLPGVLSALTNDERQTQNLSILKINPILNKAAEMKAQDMATKGYFAHTSPEGKTPWYWIELAGYKYQYAGENLAVNFRDSKDVTIAWLNSPTHKANIVKGNYTEMGTGIAEGVYQGRNTVFVAQVYANPASVVLALPKESAPVVKASVPKTPVVATKPAEVLGAEATTSPAEITENLPVEPAAVTTQEPTFLQKLAASPRNTTNVFLAVVFSVIAFALLLYLIIKRRDHHVDLVTNGFAVIAIIGAIFVANYQYSYQSMVITDSVDYSFQSK